MSEQIVFVRLKPLDPKHGNVKEFFRVGAAAGWNDFLFEQGRMVGINKAAAEWLRPLRQRDGDDSSPLAFDVWDTEAEAAAAMRAEHLAKLNRIRNVQPSEEDSKPPKLTVAHFSDLDAPPIVHEMELRQLAAAAMPAEPEAEAPDLSPAQARTLDPLAANAIDPASAFTDMMPSDDDLMALAMESDDFDDDPVAAAPPPAPTIVTTPAPRKRRGRPPKSRK